MDKEISIVMIDDNVREHDIFAIALNNLHINYRCRFIKTVEDAIKLLRKQPPDFILVDTSILDGIRCFKRIKKIRILKNIPLVAYTDIFDENTHNKILENGADICLSKTLSTAELINKLRKILA